MPRPGFIAQPGPVQSPRLVAVEGRGRAFRMRLPAGLTLLEATRQGFAAEGFASGTLNLGPLALEPFAYVMPALSRDGKNAAFYSETFRPSGISRLEQGALTFGRRDGAPFFHCHALWREADGRLTGGHILPEETTLAEDVTVEAFGISGACFEGNPDPETNFKLFGPVPDGPASPMTGSRALALRVRPNQCFHAALENFCREQGLARAVIHGGVGSLIGSSFEGGLETEPFATEVFITRGIVAPGPDGALIAEIDVGLVDYNGGMAEGRLKRGANPVLMTFELIVAEA
ncbi:MAG: DNA-binding protein [Beijerinckiaceae bacterium]|nr:DNA-binding protein [Beijerinckiaceae bacterium]